MLVLSRRQYEGVYIGDDIRVVVVRCGNGQVSLGIEAPQHVPIVRDELAPQDAPPVRKEDGPS